MKIEIVQKKDTNARNNETKEQAFHFHLQDFNQNILKH